MIKIALIDDHPLLRKALAMQLNLLQGFSVTMQASHGKEFFQLMKDRRSLPDIVITDIILPQITGFDIAVWLAKNHPQIKVVALSMLGDESTIICMFRNGISAYLMKDAEISELENALHEIMEKGIFFNRYLYRNLLPTIRDTDTGDEPDFKKMASLTPREKIFLQLLCTDKAYKEIAAAMYVSPRTVDGYRDALFTKLKVASRIGLVTFAIRNHLVQL